jgi:hypothetical protein
MLVLPLKLSFRSRREIYLIVKYKEASWVLAPDLYVSELSNVLWKYYKAKVISHEDCIQYVEDGINMIDDFIDGKELWKEASVKE